MRMLLLSIQGTNKQKHKKSPEILGGVGEENNFYDNLHVLEKEIHTSHCSS